MRFGRGFFVMILNILYPFAIFIGLYFFKTPIKIFVLILFGIIVLNFVANSEAVKKRDPAVLFRIGAMVAGAAIVIALMIITGDAGYAKFYPVIINVFLLLLFSGSIIRPPTIIWRFATLQDKYLASSPDRARAEKYCRNVTLIWCGFFILNGSTAFLTALWASDTVWSLYNGLISYILMGMLFVGEFLFRKLTKINQ